MKEVDVGVQILERKSFCKNREKSLREEPKSFCTIQKQLFADVLQDRSC